MFNKVLLVGKLENPITTKQINPSLQMGCLQLTVERTYPKSGVPFTETSIIDCDLWGKQIEDALKFDPYSTIVVEGRLRCVRRPNTKTGGESAFLSVTVEKMTLLEDKEAPLTVANQNKLDAFELSSSVNYTNQPRSNPELDTYKQANIDRNENPF